MKSEEIDMLIKNKKNNGEGYQQIYSEIETLKQSQIKFKILERELKKKKRELEKSEEERKKLKNIIFKMSLKLTSKPVIKMKGISNSKIGLRPDSNGVASVKTLTRILLILKDSKEPLVKTRIATIGKINSRLVEQCLPFLLSHNLIEKVGNGYRINQMRYEK